MNQDIASRVAYTEADSQQWKAAQVNAELRDLLHWVRVGIVDPCAIAPVVEGCARELAAVHKVPFGEVSPEFARALGGVG